MCKAETRKSRVIKISSKIRPNIVICEEGLTKLAEGILKTCTEDYKYCWAIKQLRDGGDWIFVWQKRRKKKNKNQVISRGSMYGLKGTVNDNIRQIEEYIKWHPLVAHLSDEIIQFLRKEALTDEEILEKVNAIKIA